ncbi:MAG: glycosyltransferase family 4 protein [Caldilineaceae bacterium]|nr:glycosyltransferase family 4 protein [Caldilineaceae bacterium]
MLIGIDASRALRARRTGTERYALEIIRHLLQLPVASQHQWRLYVDKMPPPALAALLSAPPGGPAVELCVLPQQRLWTHVALARDVVRRTPDVLFIPAHVLPLVLPSRRLPPSVVTIHDLGYHRFPQAHTLFQRLYLPWSTRWSAYGATALIAVSQATAVDLHHYYNTAPQKITVIHEAPTWPTAVWDQATVQRHYSLPQQYALYVGTLQPRKNLVRLLHAYHRLVQQHAPTWDLVLVGANGWGIEEIEQLIADLQLAQRVHRLGYVADEALPALYQAAHFFCFPSLFEGFGLPVLEAQSYGVPVMTTNNSALPEIAGDAAILVDPTDVEAMAEAMLRLSQDEALRQQLIAAGRVNVTRFSWAKAARETLAVLEKAARGK